MINYKVNLLDDKYYLLGRSRVNFDEFIPIEIAVAELPERSTLIRKADEARKKGLLTGSSSEIYLPKIFALASGTRHNMRKALMSGKRCVAFPDKIINIPLHELGWSDENATQECIFEVKGAGMKLKRSEKISPERFRRFLRRNKVTLDGDINEELMFSGNLYRDFPVAEGIQGQGYAFQAILATNYFLSKSCPVRLKIAPVVQTVTMPMEIDHLVEELNDGEPFYDKFAQEHRLMPSYVRGSYLENNRDKLSSLVRSIDKDENRLEKLVPVFLGDMAKYFEIIARTTRKRKKEYTWTGVGYTITIFKNPGRMIDKPYAWYIAKDVVLSTSGMYFVDLECTDLEESAESSEDLNMKHQTYFTLLFKDFSRILTLYEEGIRGTNSSSELGESSKKMTKLLVDKLNESERFSVSADKDEIRMKVKYDSLSTKEYRIRREHIPPVEA